MIPEIGKLYNIIHYETTDEFFRYVGPDNFGQEIFSALTTAEKALLAEEYLLLAKEEPLIHNGQNLVQWTFLASDKIYHTAPYMRSAFSYLFKRAKSNDKHTPSWEAVSVYPVSK